MAALGRFLTWVSGAVAAVMVVLVVVRVPASLWPGFLPYLVFEATTAVAAFWSGRATVPAQGFAEIAVPVAGTWLWMAGYWFLHGRALPDPILRSVGLAVTLCGYVVGTWAVGTLGRAFSVLPEGRWLVARGPYRFVRHPIYLAYFLTTAGALLARPTMALVVVAAVWAWLMRERMVMEERKLAAFVPGYREYAAKTGALLPRLAALRPAGER